MVNVKSDPDITTKKVQGDVTYPDGGKGILLGLGTLLSANSNGQVIIYNKSKAKWLKYKTYDEIPGMRKEVERGKINPGKSVSIHTVPAQENLGHYPLYIGSFEWSDTDPNPSDKGGKYEWERSGLDAWNWLKTNWWIGLVFLILIIVFIFLFYFYVRPDIRMVTGQ